MECIKALFKKSIITIILLTLLMGQNIFAHCVACVLTMEGKWHCIYLHNGTCGLDMNPPVGLSAHGHEYCKQLMLVPDKPPIIYVLNDSKAFIDNDGEIIQIASDKIGAFFANRINLSNADFYKLLQTDDGIVSPTRLNAIAKDLNAAIVKSSKPLTSNICPDNYKIKDGNCLPVNNSPINARPVYACLNGQAYIGDFRVDPDGRKFIYDYTIVGSCNSTMGNWYQFTDIAFVRTEPGTPEASEEQYKAINKTNFSAPTGRPQNAVFVDPTLINNGTDNKTGTAVWYDPKKLNKKVYEYLIAPRCPSGFEIKNGICVPKGDKNDNAQQQTIANTTKSNTKNMVISPQSIECPKGFYEKNGECVPLPKVNATLHTILDCRNGTATVIEYFIDSWGDYYITNAWSAGSCDKNGVTQLNFSIKNETNWNEATEIQYQEINTLNGRRSAAKFSNANLAEILSKIKENHKSITSIGIWYNLNKINTEVAKLLSNNGCPAGYEWKNGYCQKIVLPTTKFKVIKTWTECIDGKQVTTNKTSDGVLHDVPNGRPCIGDWVRTSRAVVIDGTTVSLGGGINAPSSSIKAKSYAPGDIVFLGNVYTPLVASEKGWDGTIQGFTLGINAGVTYSFSNKDPLTTLPRPYIIGSGYTAGVDSGTVAYKDPGSYKNIGFTFCAGPQVNISLGNHALFSPGLQVGYFSMTQKEFSVIQTIKFSGGAGYYTFKYNLLNQTETKTSGLALVPKIRFQYFFNNRIGLWAEGNYTIGPAIKNTVSTFSPQGAADSSGRYTFSQIQNGTIKTETRATKYRSLGVSGGIVIGIGASSSSKRRINYESSNPNAAYNIQEFNNGCTRTCTGNWSWNQSSNTYHCDGTAGPLLCDKGMGHTILNRLIVQDFNKDGTRYDEHDNDKFSIKNDSINPINNAPQNFKAIEADPPGICYTVTDHDGNEIAGDWQETLSTTLGRGHTLFFWGYPCEASMSSSIKPNVKDLLPLGDAVLVKDNKLIFTKDVPLNEGSLKVLKLKKGVIAKGEYVIQTNGKSSSATIKISDASSTQSKKGDYVGHVTLLR